MSHNNSFVGRMGRKEFVVFIAILSAFIPVSTDIYLPALPQMVDSLHSTTAVVSLSLVLFFITFAVATLFWGPLSDKYGRRPMLQAGMGIYVVASLLCMVAPNVELLIAFRVLQALGCGSATAISTAIIKDVYSGEERMRILAINQSLGMASPIFAPVLGAVILHALSWRGVFAVLAIIGVVALIGSIRMGETIHEHATGSILSTLGNLGRVLRIRSFTTLMILFSLFGMASSSYITGSSHIYQKGFGVSAEVYSLYFGANAIFFMVGPLLYILVERFLPYRRLFTVAYAVMSVCGVLIMTIGRASPMAFALCLMPASLAGAMMGPSRTNLLIEQVEHNVGAASSLMSCGFTLFGSIGMVLISLDGVDRIGLMGGFYAVIGAISLVGWLLVRDWKAIRQI